LAVWGIRADCGGVEPRLRLETGPMTVGARGDDRNQGDRGASERTPGDGVTVRRVGPAGGSADGLTLAIDGRLSIVTLAAAWDATLDPVRQAKPKRVTIDAAGLTYCDGAGLGLIAEVRRELAGWGGDLRLDHLQPGLQRLVEMAALDDPSAPQLRPPRRAGVVAGVGRATAEVGSEMYAQVSFLGEVCAAIVWAIFHPRSLRWGDLLDTADKVGTDAVPVVCLLGFLIGAILAFQSAPAMSKLGGRDWIPTLVSIAVVRELGPLIAVILMAGRTSSAFAAELGTMKVTEEVSALRAMGFDPVRFLAVPRVLAAIAMAPLLAIISSGMGVVGGYSVMVNYGFGVNRYIHQVQTALTYKDLLGGEAKTLVFGLIVGGVGCLRGLRTASGPGAVGDSTTRAVVASIVLIIVADGMFGVVYYYLGL
jgi:phospholipid/cholesterol/gamma-HCH transport system permease protein